MHNSDVLPQEVWISVTLQTVLSRRKRDAPLLQYESNEFCLSGGTINTATHNNDNHNKTQKNTSSSSHTAWVIHKTHL